MQYQKILNLLMNQIILNSWPEIGALSMINQMQIVM